MPSGSSQIRIPWGNKRVLVKNFAFSYRYEDPTSNLILIEKWQSLTKQLLNLLYRDGSTKRHIRTLQNLFMEGILVFILEKYIEQETNLGVSVISRISGESCPNKEEI
jgi:hypothetical protein